MGGLKIFCKKYYHLDTTFSVFWHLTKVAFSKMPQDKKFLFLIVLNNFYLCGVQQDPSKETQ